MELDLANRVAIVTGAAQGIGEATVRKLAQRGARVVGVDRQGDRLANVMATVPHGSAIVIDVADEDADHSAVRDVHERFGRVDILVNVAGGTLGTHRGVEGLTSADWHRVMAVNLHGPFYLCMAVAPIMKAQRWGRIITVGSGAGRSHGRGHMLQYTAAKAGVHGLMRQLAVELAPFGVLCNTVAPGMVLTAALRARWDGRDEALNREELSTVAIGRAGESEEIANVIAFLASEEASFVVGQTLSVDGGHWMF